MKPEHWTVTGVERKAECVKRVLSRHVFFSSIFFFTFSCKGKNSRLPLTRRALDRCIDVWIDVWIDKEITFSMMPLEILMIYFLRLRI